MSLMAGGAQANWLVLHGGKAVEPDVTLGVATHKIFTMLVPAQKLEILCARIEADPAAPVLLLEKSTVGHGHLIMTECKVWQSGKESPGCKPIEPILAGGLSELFLFEGRNYLLYQPLAGQPFTTVTFNPAKCALAEENEVTGSLIYECGKLEPANTFVGGDCKTHQAIQLMQEAPHIVFLDKEGKCLKMEILGKLVLVLDKFGFGENPALLDGIVSASIVGPALYIGDTWGGHV